MGHVCMLFHSGGHAQDKDETIGALRGRGRFASDQCVQSTHCNSHCRPNHWALGRSASTSKEVHVPDTQVRTMPVQTGRRSRS